jgi:hypothetical protein
MTDQTEKTAPQIRKPSGYFEVPTPTPNGAVDLPNPLAGPTAIKEAHRLGLWRPESEKTGSTDLIRAVQAVFEAVTTKIAFHESEARRLREALAPFANVARQSAAPVASPDGASAEALLKAIATELQKGDSA